MIQYYFCIVRMFLIQGILQIAWAFAERMEDLMKRFTVFYPRDSRGRYYSYSKLKEIHSAMLKE